MKAIWKLLRTSATAGGLLLLAAWFGRNAAVEAAIEREGSRAAGLETELGSVRLGARGRDVRIRDIRIGAPGSAGDRPLLAMDAGILEEVNGDLQAGSLHSSLLTLEGVRLSLDPATLEGWPGLLEGMARASQEGTLLSLDGILLHDVELSARTAGADGTPLGGTIAIEELRLGPVDSLSVAGLSALVVQAILAAAPAAGEGGVGLETGEFLGSELAASSLDSVGVRLEALVEGQIVRLLDADPNRFREVGAALGERLRSFTEGMVEALMDTTPYR